ncbi:MAG: phospholipase D-like domain-containing protein [Anaerolineaceae bacterium]|nr:phospholipase D-like domain-containing protein [Anaerolineaceae bacterium]
MANDIIDNHNQKLVEVIRTILPGTKAARFAVGYFFLSGLESVSNVLNNVQELRLLIGNTSNRETIEQIAEGYRRLEQIQEAAEVQAFPKRIEQMLRVKQTAEAVGESIAVMDQTDDAEQIVSLLVQLVSEDRLKVRVYTKGRLHAKAYIFDYAPIFDQAGSPIPRQEKGIAVVGSSNFTLSGVNNNTELNVLVHGNENHAQLAEWFETLWAESQDFEQGLMEELRQGWPLAQVTPYDVYLKTLYELVKDRLGGEREAEFLWQSEITAVLTEFQRNAVRRAAQIIREYNGCFVSDVVGLGKSYIGAAIVKHFERTDRARSLILCPASLLMMWEHYNEAYELNARVLSFGILHDTDDGTNILLDDENYRDRDFVLVDESHNFRNPGTQRYKLLQAYLQTGDRRCCLLTATPRNKTAWDIYHQIMLFHRGDLTLLPVDPPNLKRYFKMIEEGERKLPPLLSNVLIRRTRNDILRWYGVDANTHQRVDAENFGPYRRGEKRAYVFVAGKPQFFPKRALQNIEYQIEKTYKGLYKQLREYLSSQQNNHVEQPLFPGMGFNLPGLTYARYGLWRYVKLEKQNRSPYNELQRAGINLRGLMRVSLFKRLESSVEAFRCTLKRMIQSHETFIAALDQAIIPAGEDAQRLLYESDRYEEQELFDALTQVSGKYKLDDFLGDALRSDIQHDLSILQKMYELVEPIRPDQDDKLQTLLSWLNDGGKFDRPLCDHKCLIFTSYADTARYLFENLNSDGDPCIEVIYGNDKDKANLVGRFAPIANPELKPKDGAPEIKILIATDVLSEGLNLQDCDQVINYDLHWNPVRLIQRFGRIDRIGTEHDEIWGFNFLPETGLEKNLGLKEKLQHRIQEIHDTIGEDSAILDPGEKLNEEAFYAIYQNQNPGQFGEDDEDELVDLNEAQEIMRQLKEDDPETFRRIVELKDGIRCGYDHEPDGTILLCRAGNYRQLYFADLQGNVRTREIPKILNIMRCTPDTTSKPLPDGYNGKVMEIYQKFKEEVKARQSEQTHTLALITAQKYVLQELQMLMGQTRSIDVQGQISQMSEIFKRPLYQAVRQELNALKNRDVRGLGLLAALGKIYQRYGLQREVGRYSDCEENPLPVIVCSEGLVE